MTATFTFCLLWMTAKTQPPADTALSSQCSAIREIIYLGTTSHFEPIIDLSLRSSNGYQPNGTWTFSHERFSTKLPWQGASETVIEHATDERDSLATSYWQYIANFQAQTNPVNASRQLQQIVRQFHGCPLPYNDSVLLQLLPVKPSLLPPTLPENLAEAYLFELPNQPGSQTQLSLMAGLEKTRQGFRPILILELMEERKKAVQNK